MHLATERLDISPLTAAEAQAFADYRREPDVARYQSWHTDFSLADAEALIREQPRLGFPAAGEWVQYGLRLRSGTVSTLVGDVAVGADAAQPDTYELGVTLDPRHQGSGYAAEGLEAIIHGLMADHGAHRIVMQGDARNTAVLTLMRRLDLRHEGSVVEGDWFKGEWTTLERFALLRREWQAR
ncbi:GNAT family N-acetyltransferase [Microcella sp.]|uniref:GNAT family N-acetyltransferase n=1 Tax=Microcella sp. TaxID=1913979 RepID=UPI002562BBFD|nr:GNAT family protein [Microcella sp.]MBX9470719.1 GNAT family N-acetyltransferase [Microcella sp.]